MIEQKSFEKENKIIWILALLRKVGKKSVLFDESIATMLHFARGKWLGFLCVFLFSLATFEWNKDIL